MPLLGLRSTRRRSIRPPAGCGAKRYVVSRTWSRSVEQCPFQRLQPVASAAAADPAEGPGPAAGALASHLGVLIDTAGAPLYTRYQEGSCALLSPLCQARAANAALAIGPVASTTTASRVVRGRTRTPADWRIRRAHYGSSHWGRR